MMPESNNPPIPDPKVRWTEHLRRQVVHSMIFYSTMVTIGTLAAMNAERFILSGDGITAYSALRWVRIAQIAVSIIVLVGVYVLRRTIRIRTLQTLIVVQQPLMVYMFWKAIELYSRHAQASTPPPGPKLVMIVLAILEMGDIRLNGVFITLYLAESVFGWAKFVSPDHPALAYGELSIALFFGILSCVVLYLRKLYHESTHHLFEAEARATAAEYVGQTFLGMRDQANTPLQSLAVGLELLDHEPGDRETLHSLKNAFGKLSVIFSKLSAFDANVNWDNEALRKPRSPRTPGSA